MNADLGQQSGRARWASVRPEESHIASGLQISVSAGLVNPRRTTMAGIAADGEIQRGPVTKNPGRGAAGIIGVVDAQARTLAFSRSNSSAVMTPRSRRSASLASWSAEL